MKQKRKSRRAGKAAVPYPASPYGPDQTYGPVADPANQREPEEADILALFAQPGGKKKQARPLHLDEILRAFSRNKKARKRHLERLLAALTAEGKLLRLKGPAYALPAALPQMRGRLSLQRGGMGFVRPETLRGGNPGREVYIHPSQMNGAWNNDLVLVGLLPGQSGKNPEGRVLQVLERATTRLAALLLPQLVQEDEADFTEGRDSKRQPLGQPLRLARPLDSRLGGYLLIDLSSLPTPEQQGHNGRGIQAGDTVLADLLPAAEQKNDGVVRARAVSLLDGGIDSVPLFESMVKAEQGIAQSFPAAALEECAALPEDPSPVPELAASPSGPARLDLRHLDFVTIDGADARDFDDAIQVQSLPGGEFLLRVAIADVAHYVRPGSALDAEAAQRGNSCYFPASVEPMLPEALSNGLCSLKPDRPRLAMLAEMVFDAQGRPSRSLLPSFASCLIQSRARLTYEEVQAALDAKANSSPAENAQSAAAAPPLLPTLLPPLLPMLRQAEALARLLLRQRLKRGALSFELPEAGVEVNPQNGRVEKLRLRERLFAHQIIEEFMIAANEAVAWHLASLNLPFLYRAHPAPDPDKLAELLQILERNGLVYTQSAHSSGPGRKKSEAPSLQEIIDQAKGKPEAFVVNRLLLRSLMQARYTPSPEGHFGLASEAYCHFTSPIRRYADLTVHRALRHSLGFAGEKPPAPALLAQTGEHLNEAERKAVEAERDIQKICAALYLRQCEAAEPGRVYAGLVAGVSSFGLFVELKDIPAEGFLPVEELPDDYYRLDAPSQSLLGLRLGQVYRLGQEVGVRLAKTDPLRREIRFALAGGSFKPGRPNRAMRMGRASSGGFKNESAAGNLPGKSGPGGKKHGGKKRARLPKGSVRRRSGGEND